MPVRFLLAALALATAAAGCQVETSSEATPSPSTPTAPAADRSGRAAAPGASGGLALVLPTDNDALLQGQPERFYQRLNSTIDSLREEAWEGGQYGFVRDPVPTVFGFKTFRRVHEGVDIRPTARDSSGNPVDSVRAIDRGRVAHVNASAGGSSYGKYVVVEHDWEGGPIYSLYAHLASVTVALGETVEKGGTLGRMGYTGRGLGRDRAHVHLEIAMMLNRHQPAWFETYFGGQPNTQGLFFGTNLAGVNPADLLLRLQTEPGLTFPDYVRSQDEGYTVDLPGGHPLDILVRYPWLGPEAAAADPTTVPAWRVTFTQEGVPMRVEVAEEAVDRPVVDGVSLWIWLGDRSTNQMLQRRGLEYEPARRGSTYFALLNTTAEGAPSY